MVHYNKHFVRKNLLRFQMFWLYWKSFASKPPRFALYMLHHVTQASQSAGGSCATQPKYSNSKLNVFYFVVRYCNVYYYRNSPIQPPHIQVTTSVHWRHPVTQLYTSIEQFKTQSSCSLNFKTSHITANVTDIHELIKKNYIFTYFVQPDLGSTTMRCNIPLSFTY